MKHHAIVARLALSGALLLGLQIPAVAQATNARPSFPETITYNVGLEGTTSRPIVGSALAGRMRLRIFPDGNIQGTYLPEDGNPLSVTGGLGTDGSVWLLFGQVTIMGRWHQSGAIVGSSFGPAAFDRLEFVAHPVYIQHSQQRS